jgi:hypothetical protein
MLVVRTGFAVLLLAVIYRICNSISWYYANKRNRLTEIKTIEGVKHRWHFIPFSIHFL